jgi:F-type H+-transporting ATPase subunit gamma
MAESLQSLKTRLKSVKNIGQITKAMELVAATKMRRSQEIALSSRPYTLSALDMLATLLQIEGVQLPALLAARPVAKTAIVVITSDKGLAGAFNSAVLRAFEAFLKKNEIDPNNPAYTFIAVGQRALTYLERRTSNLSGKFVRFGDYTTREEIKPLTERLIEGYLNSEWDEVVVFSTHFRSALRQDVLTRRVFPVAVDALAETAQEVVPEHGRFAEMIKERKVTFFNRDPEVLKEYLIEPSPEVVLESLARHLVEAEIYQLVLEANASEWAARRMAMKSASDNASDLAQGYTLQYNKSRQASITREIIEITAGAESMQ